MRSRRPPVIRTDVVTRAMLTAKGVSLCALADELVPDMVTTGWMETGYTGALKGITSFDLVPTKPVPTLANGGMTTSGRVHAFGSCWHRDGNMLKPPGLLLDGIALPETVLASCRGRHLREVMTPPAELAALGDVIVAGARRQDRPGTPQTMIDIEPEWLEQSTMEHL